MRVNFIDPGMIMGIVIALILLAVGVFAFFITIGEVVDIVEETSARENIDGISDNYNSVLSIIGIVFIIGMIMVIVGLVYNYIGRPSPTYSKKERSSLIGAKINHMRKKQKEDKQDFFPTEPKRFQKKDKLKKKKEGWQI